MGRVWEVWEALEGVEGAFVGEAASYSGAFVWTDCDGFVGMKREEDERC